MFYGAFWGHGWRHLDFTSLPRVNGFGMGMGEVSKIGIMDEHVGYEQGNVGWKGRMWKSFAVKIKWRMPLSKCHGGGLRDQFLRRIVEAQQP